MFLCFRSSNEQQIGEVIILLKNLSRLGIIYGKRNGVESYIEATKMICYA